MNYGIVEGSENLNIEEVIRLLKMTYWADKRSREQIERSMAHGPGYSSGFAY